MGCFQTKSPPPSTGTSIMKKPTEEPKSQNDQKPTSPTPEVVNDEKTAPTPAPDPPPETGDEGTEISIYEGIDEKYTLGKELGRGGYSIVREAQDKSSLESVAVKIIDLNSIESDTAGVDPLRPLKSEIKVMLKINHPHIIKLFKVFIDDSGTNFYLVMELIPDGEELFSRIQKGAFKEPRASRLFRQLVSAVEYLHNMGVAHRDLKPENVLIHGNEETEQIKLADFGFAKHFKDEQMKTALGSPAYAAPELFTEEFYNERVDVWSLGVILYLLLCGQPPFYGETIRELTNRIVDCSFDFDDDSWENVSEAAKDLICHLLVQKPEKRYTSKELKENLWVQGLAEFKNI